METYLIIEILFGFSILAAVFSICANARLIHKMKKGPKRLHNSDLMNIEVVTTPVTANGHYEDTNTNAVHSLTTGCSINHNYSM